MNPHESAARILELVERKYFNDLAKAEALLLAPEVAAAYVELRAAVTAFLDARAAVLNSTHSGPRLIGHDAALEALKKLV